MNYDLKKMDKSRILKKELGLKQSFNKDPNMNPLINSLGIRTELKKDIETIKNELNKLG